MDGPVGPRRHRLLFWTALVASLALVAGGVGLAVRDYVRTAGPDGAVLGYFAALQRDDAPSALAFGDVPSGPRGLLTSTVLQRQQRIAPIRSVQVRSTDTRGDTARVQVRYLLGFDGGAQQVDSTLAVRRVDGSWRLAATAVSTQVEVLDASDRATLAGRRVPEGEVLLFPGAVPLEFDTPYLQVAGSSAVISFDGNPTTQVAVESSAAGKDAVIRALQTAVQGCLDGSAEPTCPLPDGRTVPGSVRGSIKGAFDRDLDVSVGASSAGRLDVSGSIEVQGSYTTLSFADVRRTVTSTFTVQLDAHAFALRPVRLQWTQP